MILQSQTEQPKNWLLSSWNTWDRFWFTPRQPHVLGLLRIFTGAMLLYCHLVLASQLTSFLGDTAWINNDTAMQLHDGAFGIADAGHSYLWYLDSPSLLWSHQVLTILVTASFMIGLLTRITGPAAWFLQLMYIHRLTGALFGLDQIVTYTVMYLMFTPCGSTFSVDTWIRKKFLNKISSSPKLDWLFPDVRPSVVANVATRLLQIHLCVIYLFGGLAKARGDSWWDGTAVWYAIGNYEYQSIDMTWLGAYPRIIAALSNITLFWEVFYCALIWPRLTRPIVLGLAIAVHGGIALFLGMATFGLMMVAANMIFIEPTWLTGFGDDPVDDPIDDQKEQEEIDNLVADLGPGSGIHQDQDLRAQKLKQAEKKIRAKYAKLKSRHALVKEREAKYRERVTRLKRREAKIKRYAERRQKAKKQRTDEQE
ncbi:HTTM domain-containing protein [Stieleria marina]|uniref:Sporulation-delaying protein SdpB n=1 Tax=Stieleria marina TaxID=1930275 RepID=A0A517NPF2_9BACT|nr:Sporulation-delaying protein SdpB [Planctomycetes bacterium K23_9]